MVSISKVKESNSRLSSEKASPTGVFTGGTDGIGRATLSRLVATKLPMRIYVIGRNGERHQSFINELRKSNDKAEIIWLEGQISLLAEVKRLCDIIKTRETSIDILFMSAGFLTTGERLVTSEGNSLPLSLAFYGRFLMMTQLLPLLKTSPNNPRVLSVLSGGRESSNIYLDDVDLEKPGIFGLKTLMRSSPTYTTLTMSRLARENPEVVFIHHYPGWVNTPLFKKAFGDRWFWSIFSLLLSVAAITPEDAGEKAVYMLTSAKYGGKGVPLDTGELPELTMAKKREPGSLYLINEKLQGLQQEKVMEELQRMDAGRIIWQKAQAKIGPYTS